MKPSKKNRLGWNCLSWLPILLFFLLATMTLVHGGVDCGVDCDPPEEPPIPCYLSEGGAPSVPWYEVNYVQLSDSQFDRLKQYYDSRLSEDDLPPDGVQLPNQSISRAAQYMIWSRNEGDRLLKDTLKTGIEADGVDDFENEKLWGTPLWLDLILKSPISKDATGLTTVTFPDTTIKFATHVAIVGPYANGIYKGLFLDWALKDGSSENVKVKPIYPIANATLKQDNVLKIPLRIKVDVVRAHPQDLRKLDKTQQGIFKEFYETISGHEYNHVFYTTEGAGKKIDEIIAWPTQAEACKAGKVFDIQARQRFDGSYYELSGEDVNRAIEKLTHTAEKVNTLLYDHANGWLWAQHKAIDGGYDTSLPLPEGVKRDDISYYAGRYRYQDGRTGNRYWHRYPIKGSVYRDRKTPDDYKRIFFNYDDGGGGESEGGGG